MDALLIYPAIMLVSQPVSYCGYYQQSGYARTASAWRRPRPARLRGLARASVKITERALSQRQKYPHRRHFYRTAASPSPVRRETPS
ncbi:hypothetical protein PUN4_80075 [Paraburkholderia unamae]|nr:hypothetical protein PUN4_80075 [Paraburkholderia unamae]